MSKSATSPWDATEINLNRTNLSVQVAEKIEKIILENNLLPGNRIPAERDLATRFGVNRSTLREAIRLLVQRGVLEMRPGSGTYVKNVKHDVIVDAIQRYYLHNQGTARDLLILRKVLEPAIAAMAAENGSPEFMAQLSECHERVQNYFRSGDVDNYIEADLDFHELIARNTGNQLMGAMMLSLHQVLFVWLNTNINRRAITLPGTRDTHSPIYEAIVARDPERAKDAMEEHLNAGFTALENELFETKAKDMGTLVAELSAAH